jgi:16S rRNA (guanine527-N7)-methyltransferase
VKHPADLSQLQAQAARLGVVLDDERADLMLRYEALLLERGASEGLVSDADLPRLRERHLLDCLRAAVAVRDSDRSSYDLGSGGGLPGIPVAIACPWLTVTLVETRRRRAAFLELAVERLGLPNAPVVVGRIEEIDGHADLAFARALAPPPEAWELAQLVLGAEGRLVYFGGRGLAVQPAAISVPGARVLEVLTTPFLESAGPLVIMAR